MILYGIIFFVFCLNAFLNGNKQTKYINFIIYIFFILIYSLRRNISNDWLAYEYFFDNVFNDAAIQDYLFEIGYKYLNYIVNFVFGSFWYLVVILGIFNGVLFWKATNRYTKNVGIVMLLSLYYIFFPTLEALRQSVTLILFYFSLEYIEKDKKKYFLLNFLGFLFHATGVFSIFFYLFYVNKNIRKVLIVFLLTFGMLEPIIIEVVNNLFGDVDIGMKFLWYFQNSREGNTIISFKSIEYALIILLYFIINKIKGINELENLAFNLVLIGFILLISVGQITDIIYRITYYTDIGVILGYTLLYDRIKGIVLKNLYVLFLIAYIFARFMQAFPFENPNYIIRPLLFP